MNYVAEELDIVLRAVEFGSDRCYFFVSACKNYSFAELA